MRTWAEPDENTPGFVDIDLAKALCGLLRGVHVEIPENEPGTFCHKVFRDGETQTLRTRLYSPA